MSEPGDVRRGDVVVVRPDPAAGHELRKTRPAVVVQNDTGNRYSGTTIVAPATSSHGGYPFEVFVPSDDSPFERDSSIRLDQIRVVSVRDRVHEIVGSLDETTMESVDEALEVSLGLR